MFVRARSSASSRSCWSSEQGKVVDDRGDIGHGPEPTLRSGGCSDVAEPQAEAIRIEARRSHRLHQVRIRACRQNRYTTRRRGPRSAAATVQATYQATGRDPQAIAAAGSKSSSPGASTLRQATTKSEPFDSWVLAWPTGVKMTGVGTRVGKADRSVQPGHVHRQVGRTQVWTPCRWPEALLPPNGARERQFCKDRSKRSLSQPFAAKED